MLFFTFIFNEHSKYQKCFSQMIRFSGFIYMFIKWQCIICTNLSKKQYANNIKINLYLFLIFHNKCSQLRTVNFNNWDFIIGITFLFWSWNKRVIPTWTNKDTFSINIWENRIFHSYLFTQYKFVSIPAKRNMQITWRHFCLFITYYSHCMFTTVPTHFTR